MLICSGALYCDLLYLWIDKDMPSKPDVGIKLTWSWMELEENWSRENELVIILM